MKSVLIVTRMGYIEGVFTSFRALANSRGATRINIEGEYEPYTETELKDIYLLRREMQNISKNLKQITMKKIEEYVVFKYEDEFGFHYMVMDKLPGEGSTYMDPISFEKKINPNCTPGAITQQPFSWDGKSAYVLSSKFVPVSGWWNDKAEVREWQERTRAYKALKELKRKGEDLKLEKAIKPLREVYARVNPSMRSIFIAQVVYLLTK